MDRLLNMDDLSEYLSVPKNTLKSWYQQRKLPFIKIGKHIRFMPNEIREWLMSNHYKGVEI